MPSIRPAFSRWIANQDPATLDGMGSAASWIGLSGLVGVIVTVSAWIPGTSAFVELDPRAALCAYALAFAGGLGLALIHEKGTSYSRLEWSSVLFSATALQGFCAGLIAHSSVTAAYLFGSMLLFTTAVHGYGFRVTPREPFLVMGTLVASGVMALTAADAQRGLITAAFGGLGAAAEVILGNLACAQDRARRSATMLREAILAQELEQRVLSMRDVSTTVVELLGERHDLRNALSSVMLDSEVLTDMFSADESRDARDDRARGLLARIERRLGDAERIIGSRSLRELSARLDGTSADPIALAGVVGRVLDSARSRAPDVAILVSIDPPDVHVVVAGGEATLARVVENLVLNACQGDGTRRAGRVEIRGWIEDGGAWAGLEVADDGPGFAPGRLETAIRAFDTSKVSGDGLGLYTAERLVRASGGSMVRGNRPEGGAFVRISLPRGTDE